MNYFLKTHRIILRAIGPVFIGDGSELVKSEYVLDRKRKIAQIIDQKKFFRYLKTKGLTNNYEVFNLKQKGNLRSWLYEQKIPFKDVESFTAYSLDCDDILDLNTMKNVMTFIRDSYGFPYVPGSSLKGAIRTVLLGADIVR
ncbi:MAG: type III-A CRISPR-associated RAMP protein Csm5, partial [Corynebacterium sp.]|nr:type III-A CRISPR-associated RAMP protein Csm5 [Corynebacterium sp.]